MKKFIVTIALVFVVAVGGLYALMSIDFNRMNADHYYVQINTQPTITESKDSKGNVYKDYNYVVEGMDEKGNQKTLEFFAMKQLREDAYLKVYVKESGVSSYDEVSYKDIPKKPQQYLSGK